MLSYKFGVFLIYLKWNRFLNKKKSVLEKRRNVEFIFLWIFWNFLKLNLELNNKMLNTEP